MKLAPLRALLTCSTLLFAALLPAQDRAPATPLITHDPYFSIWSNTDELTASSTRHWTGSPQRITGLVRIADKPYRFIGPDPRGVPAMRRTSRAGPPTQPGYALQPRGGRLPL